MTYTHLTLFFLGVLGILLHNLKDLSALNKAADGNVNLLKYFKLERFTVLTNILVVVACCFISQEISQLQAVGNWLGAGFIAIGYMGQSLMVFFIGKASAAIGKTDDKDETKL